MIDRDPLPRTQVVGTVIPNGTARLHGRTSPATVSQTAVGRTKTSGAGDLRACGPRGPLAPQCGDVSSAQGIDRAERDRGGAEASIQPVVAAMAARGKPRMVAACSHDATGRPAAAHAAAASWTSSTLVGVRSPP